MCGVCIWLWGGVGVCEPGDMGESYVVCTLGVWRVGMCVSVCSGVCHAREKAEGRDCHMAQASHS